MNLRYRHKYYADHEGDELSSEGAVRAHALSTAKDLIRFHRTDIVRDWFDCTLEVTNEAGKIVATVPFGDVVAEL
ncbi:DUF6894 family protein [Tianweitania aestuarii]|nr:hypothetical protein [Tianweitania aestuarii]